jgi:hypothetical protein
MRSLRDGAEDYLTLRRGLGFKLKRPARFLRSFVESLEKRGETRITTQLALEWATQPQHLQPAEWAARLSGVRAFAKYWSSMMRQPRFHQKACCLFVRDVRSLTCTPNSRCSDYWKRPGGCPLHSASIHGPTTVCLAFWQ